jgi:hypothetical protein
MNIAYNFFRKLIGVRIIKLTPEEEPEWEELKKTAKQKLINSFYDVYVFEDSSYMYELKEDNGRIYVGLDTKFIP